MSKAPDLSELERLHDEVREEGAKIASLLNGHKVLHDEADKVEWPVIAPQAYHGLAGEIVGTIEPHTEGDPVSVLIHFLIAFGNEVGSGPHFWVESKRHYANEFAVIVGNTAQGRKGTSWSHPRRLFEIASPSWEANCIKTGLSSGEGLIWEVRDEITKREPIREGNPRRIVRYEEVVTDPGVEDKRRLIVEEEFASVLAQVERKGNILSQITRQAWDHMTLSPMTKNDPSKATGAHISIVGHITKDELLRQLSETEKANGFGNRFLWFLVKRSKCLPEGGALSREDFNGMGQALRGALEAARNIGEMRRDDDARKLWASIYPTLSGERRGLTGSLLARAEAHVLRLSMIYALLDQSPVIRVPHLEAALAVWDYAEASALLIFGNATGDWVADRIQSALKDGPMTETDIRDLFLRNVKAERIQTALKILLAMCRIKEEKVETGGRPATHWRLASDTTKTTKAPKVIV